MFTARKEEYLEERRKLEYEKSEYLQHFDWNTQENIPINKLKNKLGIMMLSQIEICILLQGFWGRSCSINRLSMAWTKMGRGETQGGRGAWYSDKKKMRKKKRWYKK